MKTEQQKKTSQKNKDIISADDLVLSIKDIKSPYQEWKKNASEDDLGFHQKVLKDSLKQSEEDYDSRRERVNELKLQYARKKGSVIFKDGLTKYELKKIEEKLLENNDIALGLID